MKKFLTIALAVMAAGAFGAMQVLNDQDATKVGLPSLVTKVNANFVEVYGGGTLTGITCSGKTTLNGELEVNNSDVDINMTLTNNILRLDQTNGVGKETTPLCAITDARTGTTADEADEATLVITAAGAYGLSVADGIVNIEGEIDSAGDITLDPAGSDVIIDGGVNIGATNEPGDNNLLVAGSAGITGIATFTAESVHNGGIDADYITVDADTGGIDAKSSGALQVGTNTATSVNISKSTAMTTVKGTLNVDEAVTLDSTLRVEGIISNTALTASLPVFTDASKQLTSGTTGSAVTNVSLAAVRATTNVTTTTYDQFATNISLAAVRAATNVTGTTYDGFVTNVSLAAIRAATNVTDTTYDGFVTNVALGSVRAATNVTFTKVAAVTNLLWTFQSITCVVDSVTNTYSVVSGVTTETVDVVVEGTVVSADLTPSVTQDKGTALTGITVVSDDLTPVVTQDKGTALTGITVVSEDLTPVVTQQKGSAVTGITVVSDNLTPVVTTQTDTFAKP